ncbi:MAG: hypothetical protein JWM10_3082, partial [Myxococcaceae bacterium]|nr:hypothetical protein [Myxococcaceae bacterium]
MATSRAGLLDAAVAVALAAAVLDAVFAFARDADAAWSITPFTLLGSSVALVLLVGGLRAALALAWARLPAPARRW